MRRTRSAGLALAATTLIAVATGCVAQPPPGAAGAAATVVVDTFFDLKTVDPGRQYEFTGNLLTKAMYETLLTFDGADVTTPLPGLADFELSSDARTVTLTLRGDRSFSDGSPITADDVVFSLQRVQGLKGNPSFLLDGVTVAATDDRTVVLTSEQPNPALPYILPSPALSVVNADVLRANGGTTGADDTAEQFLNTTSAGSGPFVLTSLDVTSEARLARNPAYDGEEAAGFDSVVLRNVAAPTQKLNVARGDSQVALDLSGDQTADLGTSGLKVTSGASAYLVFLLLNQDPAVSAVTSNPAFVSAVKKAIDYPGLLEVAGQGAVQPPGVIPSLFAGTLPPERAMVHDPEGARADLAASGVGDQPVVLAFPSDVTLGGLSFQTVAERVQAQLTEAGMNVTLAPAPVATELDAYRAGREQMGLWYWGPDFPYASDYLVFGPDALVGTRARWTAAAAPQIAELAARAAVESDDAARTALYTEYQEALNASGPFIPLVQPATNIVTAASVTGAQYNPVWHLDLAELRAG